MKIDVKDIKPVKDCGKIFGQLAVCLPCLCCAGPHIPDALQQRLSVLGLHPSNHAMYPDAAAIRESQQTSHWNTRDFNGGFCRFNCARLSSTDYAQYGQSYRTGPDHPEGV